MHPLWPQVKAFQPQLWRAVCGYELNPAVREVLDSLEVVLGRAAFMGLEVAVTSGVFVPRRRSSTMRRTAEIAPAASTPGTAYVLLHHYMGEIDGAFRS